MKDYVLLDDVELGDLESFDVSNKVLEQTRDIVEMRETGVR